MTNGLKAGGIEPSEMKDYGFMQQRTIEDFDGNTWEIFYMDISKFPTPKQNELKKITNFKTTQKHYDINCNIFSVRLLLFERQNTHVYSLPYFTNNFNWLDSRSNLGCNFIAKLKS
jgi:hypothetical protein